MRHSSRRHSSRFLSIACLTATLLTSQATLQSAGAAAFPFNLDRLHLNSSNSSSNPGSNSSGSPAQASFQASSQLPRSVGIRVRRTIARESGIAASRLRVVTATQETWHDGCFGLGGPAELCMTALVTGWRVAVTDGSQTWVYRSDNSGRSLRMESQTGSSALPQPVRERVLAAASLESGISVDRLRIAQAEEKTWDGCLGIETGVAMCPQIAIPGWLVVVTGNGKSWVYHVNGDGSQIRLNRLATAGLESVRFLSDLTTPLDDQVLFRSTASGGIAGYTYETVLLKSGQVIRSLLRADQPNFSPHMHQVSQQEVQQFETLLQKFSAFDRLSYAASQPIPDAITITLTSHKGTMQYADVVASQLPPDLLAIIQAWGAIVEKS